MLSGMICLKRLMLVTIEDITAVLMQRRRSCSIIPRETPTPAENRIANATDCYLPNRHQPPTTTPPPLEPPVKYEELSRRLRKEQPPIDTLLPIVRKLPKRRPQHPVQLPAVAAQLTPPEPVAQNGEQDGQHRDTEFVTSRATGAKRRKGGELGRGDPLDPAERLEKVRVAAPYARVAVDELGTEFGEPVAGSCRGVGDGGVDG